MVGPSSLAMFYPHPASIAAQASIPVWKILGAALLLCGFSFLVMRQAQRRPYLPVGWLWYVGTLVPVIGLVQVGNHPMADRYTYVPLIGVFIAIAWGIPDLFSRIRFRSLALGVLGGAVVAALSGAASNQVGYWRNNVTLLSRMLAVTQDNWLAWNNLGVTCDELGQPEQAVMYYRKALQTKPDYADAWYNLGLAYAEYGQLHQAIACFREALRIKPDFKEARHNLDFAENLGKTQ